MNNLKWILSILFGCFLISSSSHAEGLPVIPQPNSVTITEGKYNLSQLNSYAFAPALKETKAFLISFLTAEALPLKETTAAEASLNVSIDAQLGSEAYSLKIDADRITLKGGDYAGILYGMQTLLQLVRNCDKDLPVCVISDKPRYGWRGFMVDESRHFFGKEKIKETLDMMVLLKLNRFHWHLTDEPGWRIEIPQYPLLTTIGSKGCWSNDFDPRARYYTVEEIKEIVSYAAARNILIIPEIDMPGHASAAMRAYPEYDGGGTPDHPNYTFNVGKEKTYTFLTDILRTIGEYFPAQWLHIGGDEVAFGIEAWKTNPEIQNLIQKNQLGDVKGAERYFMHRMSDSIRVLGKTQIAWDEVLDLHLPTQNTIVMWWRHDRPYLLGRSLTQGYRTILCPRLPMYFDFVQDSTHKQGRTWNGFASLKDVYAFPEGTINMDTLSRQEKQLIMGVQANLWSERIQNNMRYDFMTYPRLCALAECSWTNREVKSYETFTRNMQFFYTLFDRMGLYYYDARDPQRHQEPVSLDKNRIKVPMDFRD